MVFMVGFSCGFGSIPFLLMGEIFPAAQRSLLSSIAGSFNLSAMFFVIKTYHPLESVCTSFPVRFNFNTDFLQIITTAGTFWMYSALCALGMIFVIFCVPETKGRNTEDIAILFQRADQYTSTTNGPHAKENA